MSIEQCDWLKSFSTRFSLRTRPVWLTVAGRRRTPSVQPEHKAKPRVRGGCVVQLPKGCLSLFFAMNMVGSEHRYDTKTNVVSNCPCCNHQYNNPWPPIQLHDGTKTRWMTQRLFKFKDGLRAAKRNHQEVKANGAIPYIFHSGVFSPLFGAKLRAAQFSWSLRTCQHCLTQLNSKLQQPFWEGAWTSLSVYAPLCAQRWIRHETSKQISIWWHTNSTLSTKFCLSLPQ